MADDADEPLPGLALLVTQRAADVGHDQQLERDAALPEMPGAHFPPPRPAGKRQACAGGPAHREALRQPELVGGPSQKPLEGPRQQPLPGAVDDAQAAIGIEGEDRHGNLLHDRAQQRRGFERAQPLLAQRVGQRVHLDEHFAQRIVAPLPARADREVFLAQGRQQIRQRLQGVDDAVAQRDRDAPPEPDDEQGEGPLDLG